MYHQISQKIRLNACRIVKAYLAINASYVKVIESEQNQFGSIRMAQKRKERLSKQFLINHKKSKQIE